jgi:hypothetical protein
MQKCPKSVLPVHIQNVEKQNVELQNVDSNLTATTTKRRHFKNVFLLGCFDVNT